MAMDVARTAAQIIAGARERYATSPETEGGSDAFDFQVAAEGIARHGELYQETYLIANPVTDAPPVTSEAELEARASTRKARADALWQQVLPELEQYAANCRTARYTGWSREHGGPIRRVR